ncbi:hypothetical protein PMIN06_006454 [Paraphaeosphaeria minitans]
MRSHGFDTYAKLDPRGEKLQLYVANRDTGEYRGQDSLYWVSGKLVRIGFKGKF